MLTTFIPPDSFRLNICNVKFVPMRLQLSDTVNVEIFGQYIFSRISRMVSDARKYDMSENLNHYRLNGIRYKIRQNMSTRKCHKGLDARKFSSAKNVSDYFKGRYFHAVNIFAWFTIS